MTQHLLSFQTKRQYVGMKSDHFFFVNPEKM